MLDISAYHRANNLDYDTIRIYRLQGMNIEKPKSNIHSRKEKSIKIMNDKCHECEDKKYGL